MEYFHTYIFQLTQLISFPRRNKLILNRFWYSPMWVSSWDWERVNLCIARRKSWVDKFLHFDPKLTKKFINDKLSWTRIFSHFGEMYENGSLFFSLRIFHECTCASDFAYIAISMQFRNRINSYLDTSNSITQ